MPRTFPAAMLLAALALLSPGAALAGPPEGVTGKMVLGQDVAAELRRCRSLKNEDERLKQLMILAPSRDVRVAIAVGEELDSWLSEKDSPPWLGRPIMATILLYAHFLPPSKGDHPLKEAVEWWITNQADLRRRAAQIPR